MRNVISTIIVTIFTSVSLIALEPISVIVEHNTGQGLSVQLVDYGDSEGIDTVYTEVLPSETPNSSGLLSYIIGAGEVDWTDITANEVTAYYVLNILDNSDNIIAQHRLDGLIHTSAKAGIIGGNLDVGGNIVADGFISYNDAGTFTDSTSLSTLVGNIFVYNGDDLSDEITFDSGDLNADIPDNTIIYIVNNSRPDEPDSSDVIEFVFNAEQEATLPIIPLTSLGILKVDGNFFPLFIFPFF